MAAILTTTVRGHRGAELRTWSDRDLLAGVRAGSDAAYGELYRRHEPALRRFVRSLVAPSQVDDTIAETFVRVLAAISRGNGPDDEPIRYLIVSARSVAARWYRQHKRAEGMHQRLASSGPAAGPEDLLADPNVEAAFRSLPERWQQAIWWSEIDELGPAEIGERFEIGPNAASALTYRARKALRDAYQTLESA